MYGLSKKTNNVVVYNGNSKNFEIIANSNKVALNDCDNDRQPEIAIWPPKPEVPISGSMIDSVGISTANLGFSTMRVKESVPQ